MLHGTEKQKILGDDGGCFAHALWAVRTFGGVLEHPEGSHAWEWFGLPRPGQPGGWTDADNYGGRSCCVAQGKYGHRAQKLTWLYGVRIDFKELDWGTCPNMERMGESYHSKAERDRAVRTGICQRLSKKQRLLTPSPFRDLLMEMVSGGQKT